MTQQSAKHALTGIRETLQCGQKDLAAAYLARPDHKAYLAGRSELVDHMLQQLWIQAQLPKTAALIAVGGYGRNELYPHSDIDVLIALESLPTPEVEVALERLVSQFWDIGLAVGHSVRTIDECITAAQSDITVQTALSESRLICGQAKLQKQLQQAIETSLAHDQFIAAKLAEQEERHLRYAFSAFSLEPNCKESPGGLRDLHSLNWIARAAGFGAQYPGFGKRAHSPSRLCDRI